MCGSEEPIQLFRPFPQVKDGIKILIFDKYSKPHEVSVSLDYTVKTVKLNAYVVFKDRADTNALKFNGIVLKNHRTLRDYGIQDGDVLKYRKPPPRVHGELAGYAFRKVDLDGQQEVQQAKETVAQKWEGYDIGLNLYGICPNANCISKRGGPDGAPRNVVFQTRYGFIRMIRNQSKFPCPACKYTVSGKGKPGDVGMFTPKNFLVCYARSLFQFKKIGALEPVKRVLMESQGLRDHFSDFNEGGASKYDFIEITTVGKDSSPFRCVACDKPCFNMSAAGKSEVVLSCGHAYHAKCHQGQASDEECFVCCSEFYESVPDFLQKEGEGIYDKRRKRSKPGYDVEMYGAVGLEEAEIQMEEEEYEHNFKRLEEEEQQDKDWRKNAKRKKANNHDDDQWNP